MTDYIITLEAVEAAERVLAFIIEHPEAHEQAVWINPNNVVHNESIGSDQYVRLLTIVDNELILEPSCGTTACFAGWLTADQKQPVKYYDGGVADVVAVLPDGDLEEVGDWACAFLGIPGATTYHAASNWEGAHMFDAGATLDDIKAWVAAMRTSYETGRDIISVLLGEVYA